ncbi:MAG: hypothetical protein K6L75_04140 [Cellvibrionaceae bacterium]|uniref:CopL family metal-binding regulatory protein n=1 Tax=Halioxenophilus aromaticivorans TaxID=1306992 RepID=A0AAV3U2I0_9ALTE
MLKRALTFFVLTLVVMQSVVAMGDAHQLHQSGAEHRVFDEAHLHNDGDVADAQHDQVLHSDASTVEKWDCHHCCHCHGHLCPAVLISVERIQLLKHCSPVPDYAENTFPETHETFLRPPKA